MLEPFVNALFVIVVKALELSHQVIFVEFTEANPALHFFFVITVFKIILLERKSWKVVSNFISKSIFFRLDIYFTSHFHHELKNLIDRIILPIGISI